MCGIVGALSDHEVAPILVEALKRLEYRGYDSAGIATVQDGRLDRRRAVGKLVNLSDLLVHDPLPGRAGIGHTRWATHGAPTVTNAHPHRAGPVSVVHNGIIENYAILREELTAKGMSPETDTDTETVAQLVASYLSDGLSPVEAAEKTLGRLDGAYALCFLFDGEDDLMIAARKGSPLAIGHGDGEVYVGSDAIALAPMTDRITYLEEGDWAVLTRTSATIRNADGQLVNRQAQRVRIDTALADKGGHKHFMAKEIAQQPTVVAEAVAHYVARSDAPVALPEPAVDFTNVSRVTLVACGTAYLACLTAKYWLERLAGLPVEVDIASEFRYREPPVPEGTLAVFVSQSGETADTLAALRYMQDRALAIVAVVNVPESSIAREADIIWPIHAGPEIGVASTKAFTCMLTVLMAATIKAAEDRGTLTPEALAALKSDLSRLPGLLHHALAVESTIETICAELSKARDVLFLGRGAMYPIALEGALKLKEISYIHAEGYASGELKHGPIALVDPAVPVIVMAPRDRLHDKTVSNMQEVLARQGRVLLVSDRAGVEDAGDQVWGSVTMPEVPDALAPIVYAVPAQLIAYYTAVAKGTDVDQPRNLAKSVTVE
ncbi:MAG: glutamine--fructose-6-phosphate transaminase (isomerizing) [Pseudomonadota bacterium]